MSFKLDIKRKVTAKSNRAKCVDIHPSETWYIVSLYNGVVNIWDYMNESLIKTFNISVMPVRAVRFISRKCWFIAAGDDLQLQIYNYNTMDKVHSFEAHSDYIRSLAVNPSLPYVISSGDDMLIKLWDWDNKWQCIRIFEGHQHYVMSLVFNPKDHNLFASASLDKSIKIWHIGFSQANLTIDGHSHGSNSVDYCYNSDKPYLVSGGDDGLVKIWDYQTKSCIQTLIGHSDNVMVTRFHPDLPLILTGSEDGTIRIWNSITYKLEIFHNYGLGRVWDIRIIKGVNGIAIAFDEASIFIQIGDDYPKISMDPSGKILFCKNSDIFQANTKIISNSSIKDGESITFVTKELGACEVFPNKLLHSPNGKYVAVIGSSEFTVYTALALRSKVFGKSGSFAWSSDSSSFATVECGSVKLYKNFQVEKTLKLTYNLNELFGGNLLGIGTNNEVFFYNWDRLDLIHRIEITPFNIYWNSNGNLCTISSDNTFYILKYNWEMVDNYLQSQNENDPNSTASLETGIDHAFELMEEYDISISSGIWIGDCFLFINNLSKLCYSIGEEIIDIAHMEKSFFILNFVSTEDKIYLVDKSFNIVSYKINASVLHFQTLITRGEVKDTDLIYKLLSEIPKEDCNRISHFLENKGYYKEALFISTDNYHKFSLTLKLNEYDHAIQLANTIEDPLTWKKLAIHCMATGRLDIARDSLWNASDYATLLLLCYCIRDAGTIRKIASKSLEMNLYNVAFISNYIIGNLKECNQILLQSKKYPEATLFAHTYDPLSLEFYFDHWKQQISVINDKYAASLASPTDCPEMFENFHKIINQNNSQTNYPDTNNDVSTDEMVSADGGMTTSSDS